MSITTRVWITGAEGRLGRALVHRFDRTTDYEILATDLDVPIDDHKAVSRFVKMYHPDVIINCAALSNIQECEENPDKAFAVNTIGARNLAIAARKVDAKIIHISTDDVFNDNDGMAKNEFERPTPSTVYGKSKLAGEEMISRITGKHIIIRSSWLYGYNYDYLDQILEKAKNGETITIDMKRHSTPTTCHALVGFIECIIDASEYGIFHASCDGDCRRKEFFEEAIKLAGYTPHIEVVSEENTVYSILDNMMLRITNVYQMPHWKDDLKEYIERRKKRGVL